MVAVGTPAATAEGLHLEPQERVVEGLEVASRCTKQISMEAWASFSRGAEL